MDGHAESVSHGEGDIHDRRGLWPRVPSGLHELLEESFPLIAEDLRAATVEHGITSKVAAECAGIDPALYRRLEEGSAVRSSENLGLMLSAAESLGLKEVRFSFVHEVQQQCLKLELPLPTDGPLVLFLDKLRYDVQELKEQSVFVSPYQVLVLVERIGFNEAFASRKPAGKQLIELWIAAVFTLCLGRGRDYYVGLGRYDPPDAEVLGINGTSGDMSLIPLEITQYGIHSRDLAEVVGKKLRKKYQEGTVLVVLVEQAENLLANDLDNFIRTNNPYNQQLFIIGGSEASGSFKVLRWDEVAMAALSNAAWLEADADANNVSRGYRGYEGVVFKPKGSRFLPLHPVFVKELELHSQM